MSQFGSSTRLCTERLREARVPPTLNATLGVFLRFRMGGSGYFSSFSTSLVPSHKQSVRSMPSPAGRGSGTCMFRVAGGANVAAAPGDDHISPSSRTRRNFDTGAAPSAKVFLNKRSCTHSGAQSVSRITYKMPCSSPDLLLAWSGSLGIEWVSGWTESRHYSGSIHNSKNDSKSRLAVQMDTDTAHFMPVPNIAAVLEQGTSPARH